MDEPILKKEEEYPDNAVLEKYLKDTKPVWDFFIEMVNTRDYTSEWRFYKDGYNWLFKVTKKKKTICWAAVFDGYFKNTFYFGAKAEEMIVNSSLAPEYTDQFLHGKRWGKIRGITVDIRNPDSLETSKILMDIREKLK
ncbi:MAG: DUF3788 domain-containing protein [Bacteroidales bacterium]|nr:DUF3788 domain-containing protein [Bacteroidales bacterium]